MCCVLGAGDDSYKELGLFFLAGVGWREGEKVQKIVTE